MTFGDSDAYDRFMGRFSGQLGRPFADFAGVEAGGRALDVGCGPGVLTAELVARLGAENVSAVDPACSSTASPSETLPLAAPVSVRVAVMASSRALG